jgi:Domain of unknown function (DUF397)
MIIAKEPAGSVTATGVCQLPAGIDRDSLRVTTSSHSGGDQPNCVGVTKLDNGEIAYLNTNAGPNGNVLVTDPAAWKKFLADIQAGEFDDFFKDDKN